MLISSVCKLLGGVTVFLLGLKLISDNFANALGDRMKKFIANVTKSRYEGACVGAVITAIAQSSVAINVVLVSLVDASIISFTDACAVIIGTNIGTTMTAQLVSLTFSGKIGVTEIGALVAFAGFLLTLSKNKKVVDAGNISVGFGLVFIGIEIITNSVEGFYGYGWFRNFFMIESGAICLLNGFFITAICQSSSICTSVLVILASSGMVSFERAVYLILGANVGSCVSVIIASQKRSLAARRTALFNLVFNALGVIVFYAVTAIFPMAVTNLFISTSGSVGAAVANFHTFFNLAVGVVALPFVKSLAKLTEVLSPERNMSEKSKKSSVFNKKRVNFRHTKSI